jgi:UDP-N-acetylglucosamine 1-carboxyvinyltransferase
MGAHIERSSPDVIEVEGVRRLRGADHVVIADRIEAGTFIIAAAVTGGEVRILDAPSEHLGALLEVLEQVGVGLRLGPAEVAVDGAGLHAGAYRATSIETGPYPGFATDLQAPTAVLLTQAAGESRVHETIFEDRLDYTAELVRMGARIELLDPHHCRISGPTPLRGAELEVPDLRAGASLILAALAAEGRSVIDGAIHVERGYENIEHKFVELGARIERRPAVEAMPQPV